MIEPAPSRLRIELMSDEIEQIIDELQRVPHNLYEFSNYKALIEKLRASLNRPIVIRTEVVPCAGCGEPIETDAEVGKCDKGIYHNNADCCMKATIDEVKIKTEAEFCEGCGVEITDEMKDTQEVIYASAEHTMSKEEGQIFPFRDAMFFGPFCGNECYRNVSGITFAYHKGEEDKKLEILKKLDEWFNAESTCSGEPHCCVKDCDLCVNCLDELKKLIGETE